NFEPGNGEDTRTRNPCRRIIGYDGGAHKPNADGPESPSFSSPTCTPGLSAPGSARPGESSVERRERPVGFLRGGGHGLRKRTTVGARFARPHAFVADSWTTVRPARTSHTRVRPGGAA